MKKTLLIFALFSKSLSAQEPLHLNFSDSECHKIIRNDRFFKSSEHSIDLVVRTFYRAASYIKDSSLSTPEPKLLTLYIGSKLKNGVLTLKFQQDARALLNGSSCEQTVNRMPLERTLLKYPGIKKLIFVIEKESFEEFDA